MSAQLYFNYVYAADASQTTTLTATGEEQGAAPATPDEVVQVNVSAGELNGLMTVGAQSEAGVGYPEVTLDWISLQGKTDSKWTNFMAVQAAGIAPIDFTDDSTLGSKPTLQKVFATQTFTYVTNAESLLLAIPPEAISNVDYSGAISLKRGAGTLSDAYMGGSSNRILGAPITAPSGDLTDDDKKAVRGLFLQALAAGRYQQSNPGVTGGADLPAGASPGFDFQVGDVVSVYTQLTLTKTRTFIPDPSDVLDGAGGMKFKVDGSTVIIGDTNAADDSVESDAKTWVVEWKLTVA